MDDIDIFMQSLDIERMIEYAREEGVEKTNLDHAKKMLAWCAYHQSTEAVRPSQK